MNVESITSVAGVVGLAIVGQNGRGWYRDAATVIAAEAAVIGVTAERFAAVLAITSPRVRVRRNWTLTVQYLSSGSTEGIMKSTRAALAHYEIGGEIRGPKTGPFARACLGDPQAVVLDVWMARAFNVDPRRIGGKRLNAECTQRVQAAAGILGWTPADVQAAVWTATVRAAGKEPGRFGV
jgi:hypothetical protein